MQTSIWLVAIPEEYSIQKRLDLNVLMKRALRVEERMVKGVQIEDEQKRYQTLCDRIEYLGNLISAEFPVVSYELGADYFELLLYMADKFPDEARSIRLFSNFCPVERLNQQLSEFQNLVSNAGLAENEVVKRKVLFYQNAINNNWIVLELLQLKNETENFVIEENNTTLKKDFLSLKVSEKVSSGLGTGPFVGLRNQINKSVDLIRHGMSEPVDFSDLRHDVITEILHEFVYSAGKPLSIPILYGDGSKALPFPIFALRNRRREAIQIMGDVPILNVGMMSSRHHELDKLVKVYWFRNQEISIGRTLGETDSVAYKKAKELFTQMRNEGIYRIGFYQTGFQPAVVGFYRALTEELLETEEEPVAIEVTPVYFLNGEYRHGLPWS
jgi:hypothetical protein